MLKIGDFSKLSKISIRMLRYYDDLNLLKPDTVDPFTGYRYYSEQQLVRAGRIQALRQMGFGVAMVGQILEQYTDAPQLERFLCVQRQEMLEQKQTLLRRLQTIDSTIERLRKDGSIMGYEVNLKTVPERYVASVRMTLPTYQDEGELWRVLCAETAALHVQEANPPYVMVIYHDGEYRERDVDVEAQKAVIGAYADTEHVRFKAVPAVQFASAVFQGGYDQISAVNEAVAQWIADNGYELNGLSFNLYHVTPNDTANPDEYVTEVCYPVKRK